MTPKLSRILIYIAGYINQHNQAPLYREMADAFGYQYAENMSYYISRLVKQGYIKHNGNKRGLEIVKIPKHPCLAIRASLEKAMAWEWRRDPMPSEYVKKGYPKKNPKLTEYHKKRKAGEL